MSFQASSLPRSRERVLREKKEAGQELDVFLPGTSNCHAEYSLRLSSADIYCSSATQQQL